MLHAHWRGLPCQKAYEVRCRSIKSDQVHVRRRLWWVKHQTYPGDWGVRKPNQVVVLPKPNQVVVLPKPNQVVVLPKPNQVVVLPKPNQVVVLPKPNQVVLLPKPNQSSCVA